MSATFVYPTNLTEKLADLADFGIHLTNRQGVCHKCQKQTQPYSNDYNLDTRQQRDWW